MAITKARTRAFSALRSAIIPERSGSFRQQHSDARRWLLLGALLVGGCSRSAKAVRLPSDAEAEIYRITCGETIEVCRQKADELCRDRYEILESVGAPISPPRVSSAPGPRSTGSRYQHPDWAGQIVVACVRTATAMTPDVPLAATHDTTTMAGRACVPGATQECLGPGACRGAQACLVDGRGYSACDCGSAGSAAGSPIEPADAGSLRE